MMQFLTKLISIIAICKDDIYGTNEYIFKFTIEYFCEGMSLDTIKMLGWFQQQNIKKDKEFSTTKHRTLQAKKAIGHYVSAVVGDFKSHNRFARLYNNHRD